LQKAKGKGKKAKGKKASNEEEEEVEIEKEEAEPAKEHHEQKKAESHGLPEEHNKELVQAEKKEHIAEVHTHLHISETLSLRIHSPTTDF